CRGRACRPPGTRLLLTTVSAFQKAFRSDDPSSGLRSDQRSRGVSNMDIREARHGLGGALDRRRFLRLGATTLGAAALTIGADVDASVAATPAVATAPSELPLLGGPEYPIGFFWPPPKEFTTSARYAEIAEAG